MSLRASRRSREVSAIGIGSSVAAAQVLDVAPSVPISEIRVRKWTKQLKTVGHLSIPKWVPGRKRQTGEIGRMTRSVRQHLDAPLELLTEFPSLRNNAPKHVAPSASVVPPVVAAAVHHSVKVPAHGPVATINVPAATIAVTVPAQMADSATYGEGQPATTPVAVPASSSLNADSEQHSQQTQVLGLSHVGGLDGMHMAASGDLPSMVPSDEQLEMALDDLPMLDSDEDLPFDSLTEDQIPPAVPVQQQQERVKTGKVPPSEVEEPQESEFAAADDSVENTAESNAEGDDDDEDASSSSSSDDGDDDDDDNGSANSGSPAPSPSPQSSPMMSRSPSP